jgi:hypothetical protein
MTIILALFFINGTHVWHGVKSRTKNQLQIRRQMPSALAFVWPHTPISNDPES